MPWWIFLLISVFAESAGRTFQRAILKGDNTNPKIYMVWAQLMASAFVFLYTLVVGFKLPANLPSLLPYLALVPIFYTFGPLFIYKSLQLTEVSIFTILFNSRAIIVVLGSVILLHNSFTPQQILGTFLILSSVVAISLKKEKFQFKKGELFSLFAGFLIALGTINDAVILKTFNAPSYVTLGFLAPAFFMLAISPKITPQVLAFPKTKTFPKMAILSLCFATTYLTYTLSYTVGHNAAQIAAIFPVSSVLTVLFSIIFLGEKDRLPVKIAAALVSFLGVWLIS